MKHRVLSTLNSLKLLFVGTGNSCSSQMAEGWSRHLSRQLPPYLSIEPASAGFEVQELNSFAVAAMAERDVDISSLQPRQLTDAMVAEADLIVTLGSQTDTISPTLPPGKPELHIPLSDPMTVSGGDEQIRSAFARICEELREAVTGLVHDLILQCLERVQGNVFDQSDVQILAREQAYSGFIPVEVLHLRHRLFAGGWSEKVRRELARRPAAVGVLLFDPASEDLVMVKQFRTGALDAGHSPWMLEIVAGLAGPDEAPVDVAKREALEEANCEITEAVPVCEYLNSPGWCDEKVSLYCARVDATALQGIHGLDAEHEDILIVSVPLQKALNMIAAGEINNAMSIIAIQWLQLNKDRFSFH